MLLQRSEVLAAAFGGLELTLSPAQLADYAERGLRLASIETHSKSLDSMTFDIFLSHAYADRVLVFAVFSMLTQMGFDVYVDWIHDANFLKRGEVTPETARQLRLRMQQCQSLFYLTTSQHSTSKWMPWECGYFDGADSKSGTASPPAYARFQGRVAILPVVETKEEKYSGQEYLGLYCYAEKGTGISRNIEILAPASVASIHSQPVKFDNWIKGVWPN